MSIQLEIHKHNLQRVNNIFNGFEGQDMSKDISKAITEEEFHERFSAGYQVFTKRNIQDFVKAFESDLIEKGFDSNAIETALNNEGKTLESVLVKKDGKVFEVFVKSISTNIEKGGEGSKGGKIIGHTKSGKPIYASANHSEHKDFTHKEHDESANLHQKMINKISDKLHGKTNRSYSNHKGSNLQSGMVKVDKNRMQLESDLKHHEEQLGKHIDSKFDKMKEVYHSNKSIINSTLKQEGRHTPNTEKMLKENKDIEVSFKAREGIA